MSEWKEYKLGELGKIVTGKTPPTSQHQNYDGDIPFICIPDLGKSRFIFHTNKTISKIGLETVKNCSLPKGSVVVSCIATIGQVGITTKDISVTNQQINSLIPDSNLITEEFCYYYFKNLGEDLAQFGGGGSIFEIISKDKFSKVYLTIPSLPEQTAIASVLSSLDDKIDLLHRQNATLEKMGETLFRQWFVEDAKEEWESGRVGDLIRILSGFAFKSSSFVESGKYRLITIKGVQDGYLELTNSDRIDELPEQMPEFCKLQIGDILLSLTGNVGRCCLVDTTYLLLNQRVAKLHPIKERDKAFTYFLFRQPQIKQILEEMAKGTAQANLSPVETSNMELKIPDNNTLNEFSSLVTPWVEKLIFNKKSIQTLTQIRDFLLPKLMSGEVAVEIA
jgi:type I restriction enzyme S subunit